MIHQHFQPPWVAPFDESVKAELSVTKNDPPFTSFQLATIDSETDIPKTELWCIVDGYLIIKIQVS